MSIVRIDYPKCIGCKICYNLCPIDVFTWDLESAKFSVWSGALVGEAKVG